MSSRFSVAECSYTSLGQDIKSNSCANHETFAAQSMRYAALVFLLLKFLPDL
jgi:hypothetical protein